MKSFLIFLVSSLILSTNQIPGKSPVADGQDLNARLQSEARQAESDLTVPELRLPPLKERLVSPNESRDDSFGNSRVDIAPKSWPYPMVTSPNRPVLPGTAW